jgi:hypothetical protein
MIELGVKAKSVISGFTGIITGRTEYINGCVQYAITPKAKDGKVESEWFDEQEVQVIGKGVDLSAAATGGPQRNAAPTRPGRR